MVASGQEMTTLNRTLTKLPPIKLQLQHRTHNAGSQLDQRRRRWSNCEPTLCRSPHGDAQ